MNRECTFCEGGADFIWFDDNGQWFVCSECIKDGKTDAESETRVINNIVWSSQLTSEQVDEHLSTDELTELVRELDKAVEAICTAWGVE